MPAMSGAPPILEQTRDETVAVSPWFQVPVVLEHSKYVVDRHRMIGHRPGREVLAVPVDGGSLQHAVIDCGLGQQRKRGTIAIGAEDQLQPALVVIQIRLPANAEHLVRVHAFDVFEGSLAPTSQAQVLVETVEEPLDVVGNQTPQPAAHLLTRGQGQVEVACLRERGKTLERGLLLPGLKI